MTNTSTNMTGISTTASSTPSNWSHIEFSLFLFGQLMSIPCYLFMFYHLLAHKTVRKALHNHAIIVMLIFNFIHLTIDLTMTMNFLRLGYVSGMTPALCLTQQFVDYGIWYGALFLMLWISIERHILIFHSVLVSTARGRLLFHYIPLALFASYAPILYFYLVFLHPCVQTYDATKNLCSSLCYHATVPRWFVWYESLFNYTIPILLIVVLGVSLGLRVILQKRRLQRASGWRRNRKMIIQLVLISAVYLIFDLPFIVITIVRWAGIPTFGKTVISPYISHLTYVPAIVLPYATLVTLHEVKKKIRALVFCKTNGRAIAPSTAMK